MRFLLLIVVITGYCLSPTHVAAQFSASPSLDAPVYYGGDWQNNRNKFLWDNTELLQQVDITRDQRREFFELKMDYEDATRDLNKQLKKLQSSMYEQVDGKWIPKQGVQQEIKDMKAELKKLSTEYKDEAKKVLLPHQVDMLERIKLRKTLNNQRLTSLVNRKLDAYLDLTDRQKEKIRQIAKEEHQRLEAEIAKALKATEKRLMRELSKEQQDRFGELLGEWEIGNKLSNNGYNTGFWLFSYESWFARKKKD